MLLLSLFAQAAPLKDEAYLFSTWARHAELTPPGTYGPQGGPNGGIAPPRGGADLLDGYKAGDLFVVKDWDGEWFSEAITEVVAGNIDYITNSVTGSFYNYNEDNYDYVCILLLQDFGMFFAFYQPIANDTYGIGYDSITPNEVFDTDTTNKLDGLIFMNYEGLWSGNLESGRYVFGQEFMHRWGAFTNLGVDGLAEDALLGRDTAHWSYWMDTTNSPMEGNRWVDNGDGTWSTVHDDVSTYSDLDLYLMGFAGPEEVGQQTFLVVSEEEQARVAKEPASSPAYFDCASGFGACSDVTVAATPTTFGVDAIIAAEGDRVPSAEDSPREFKMAFIVLALQQDEVSAEQLERVDTLRQTWERDWEEDVRNRADLITTLDGSSAPDWTGEAPDSGGEDSSVPTDDSGAPDSNVAQDSETPGNEKEEPKGCGCDSSTGAGAGILLAVAGLVARRREVRKAE